MTTDTMSALALPAMTQREPTGRGRIATVITAGGALIVAGALLPWFSFFAGLHPVPGVAGLNGKLLLATGVAAMLAGALYALRGGETVARLTGWAGVLLTVISGVLLVRLFAAHEQLAANPMMVAEIGPGLFVLTAGAAVLAGLLLVPRVRAGGRAAIIQP